MVIEEKTKRVFHLKWVFMYEIAQETKNLFQIRLKNTFALNEKHKQIILQDLDTISLPGMNHILNILDNYEYLIIRDDLYSHEEEEKKDLNKELDDLMNNFNF